MSYNKAKLHLGYRDEFFKKGKFFLKFPISKSLKFLFFMIFQS